MNITHGHLPHWDQEGATYFITWRTADSLPKPVWEAWRTERAEWLKNNGIDPSQQDWRKLLELLPDEKRRAFRRFSSQLEHAIDAGHGECSLLQNNHASIVADTLKFFDGQRYTLSDFVIMPNHVHVIVGGLARQEMLRQVESWKKWSAIKINEALGRKGRFWQDESFDHLIRGEESFQKFRRYIAENPVKARLSEGEYVLWQKTD